MNGNTVISPVDVEERKALDLRAGDTVRVTQKIEDKGKIRLQVFEGVVLATKHGHEAGATFTVRRVSKGYGVEKIFPLYSPQIDKIEIVRRAKVRRAKLYYIREKAAREIRRQMRRMIDMYKSTESGIEREAREKEEAEAAAKAAEEAEAKDTEETPTETPEEAPTEETAEEVPSEEVAEDTPESEDAPEEQESPKEE